MRAHIGEMVFFWILFGIAGSLTYFVMQPYFTPLFLAAVFSIMFTPLYTRSLKLAKGNETLAALFTVILVFCCGMIPLIFFGTIMFQEVQSVYSSLIAGNVNFTFIDHFMTIIQQHLSPLAPSFNFRGNFADTLARGLVWVSAHLSTLFSGIFSLILQIILVLVAMFYFYRDGKKIRSFITRWSPLSNVYDDRIITTILNAVNSVIKSAVAAAFVQGLLAGVGSVIFGIPNPVLIASVAMIASFIPVIGSGAITVPIGIFLIISGDLFSGIGFLLWVLIVVGTADNFIRPWVIGRGVKLHPFVIFLSVIGGLAFFGPVGIIAGPVTMAFLFALLELYPAIVLER